MDLSGSALTEIVAMSLRSRLVSLNKRGGTHALHTICMLEGSDKVQPLLALDLTNRAVKEVVNTWMGLVKKGDEVVCHHRLGP